MRKMSVEIVRPVMAASSVDIEGFRLMELLALKDIRVFDDMVTGFESKMRLQCGGGGGRSHGLGFY
jgi:hypothetical protein